MADNEKKKRAVPDEQKTVALRETSTETLNDRTRTVSAKWKTFSTYMCIWSFGLCVSMVGPTLPVLEIFLATDLKHLSWWATAKCIGSMAGALSVGLVLTRVKHELVFTIVALISSASMCAAPSLGSVQGFVVAMAGMGISGGVYNAAGQVYMFNLWKGSKYRRPVVQAFHLFFSIGAVIGPLLVRLFIVPIAENGQPFINSTLFNSSNNETQFYSVREAIGNTSFNHTDGGTVQQKGDISVIRFAYVVGGVLALIGGVLFLWIYLFERSNSHDKQQPSHTNSSNSKHGTTLSEYCNCGFLHTVILGGVFLCIGFFAIAFHVPGTLMASFVVKELGWSVADASLLTSLYYAGYCVTRIPAVPVSLIMSPTTMLIVSMSTTLGGFIMMAVLCHVQAIYVYISVTIAGSGLATIMGSLYLWTSNNLGLTGRETGIIQSGFSLGEMGAQPLTAFLFQAFSPMWMIYVSIIASAAELLIFIFLQVLASCCRNRLPHASRTPVSTQDGDKDAKDSTV